MNKFTKTIVGAAIATLAVAPSPPTTGRAQDAQSRNLAASMQARRERRDATLESLIDAQQKCYDRMVEYSQRCPDIFRILSPSSRIASGRSVL